MFELFSTSFGIGNFNDSKAFSYSHCIIDLDPIKAEYDEGIVRDALKLPLNKFPMRFVNGVNVNETDEFKRSKIVLTRVEPISGENFDTFTMGSHKEDYALITDPYKRKYRDTESIVDGAVDDHANVLLGNGGSYQKKKIDKEEQELAGEPHVAGDLFGLEATIGGKRVMRYWRNKHFFIDPFELTIAQWCYLKVKTTPYSGGYLYANKANARQLLTTEGHLDEIQRSYWKYLSVWETDEWNTLKSTGYNQYGVKVFTPPAGFVNYDDQSAIEHLVSNAVYNPLDDIRPYYYATYNNVRGTP
jgi:hypothetical protein